MPEPIDISNLCPCLQHGHKALLFYYSIVGTPAVELRDEQPQRSQVIGVFDYKYLGKSGMISKESFKGFAEIWSLTPDQLADIVLTNAEGALS